jgi:hypothetical protein
MNIFYLDPDPVKAASYMYDKHKVKMILESAQMLCTAHHAHSLADETEWVPYKKAHLNHPSSRWCRQSASNYLWLYYHMLALGDEYTKRYGKTHLSITKCKKPLAKYPDGILHTGFTEPPQCMPDEYKVEGDSLSAYWNYYEQEKSKIRNKNEQKISRPLNQHQL